MHQPTVFSDQPVANPIELILDRTNRQGDSSFSAISKPYFYNLIYNCLKIHRLPTHVLYFLLKIIIIILHLVSACKGLLYNLLTSFDTRGVFLDQLERFRPVSLGRLPSVRYLLTIFYHYIVRGEEMWCVNLDIYNTA